MLLKYLGQAHVDHEFQTDHHPIFTKVPCYIDSNTSIRILSRNFHSIDYDNSRKDILNSSLCDKPL